MHINIYVIDICYYNTPFSEMSFTPSTAANVEGESVTLYCYLNASDTLSTLELYKGDEMIDFSTNAEKYSGKSRLRDISTIAAFHWLRCRFEKSKLINS